MYERLWCQDENQHSEYGVLFFTPLANALARVYANPALQVCVNICVSTCIGVQMCILARSYTFMCLAHGLQHVRC